MGGAGPRARDLLDAYSTERVFAARENIRHASKSTDSWRRLEAFQLMREARWGSRPGCVFRNADQPAPDERDHPRRFAAERRRFRCTEGGAGSRRGASGVSGRNRDGLRHYRAARPRLHRVLPVRRRPTGGDRRASRLAAPVLWITPRRPPAPTLGTRPAGSSRFTARYPRRAISCGPTATSPGAGAGRGRTLSGPAVGRALQ